MINFALPGMYEQYPLILAVLEAYKKSKYFFRDNVNISAVYGNFPYCIFDGGRPNFYDKQCTSEKILKLVNLYNNEYNIPIRQIFTNSKVQESDYYNRFENICLSLCNNPGNEIVIVDNGLMDYIKNNYENYNFISSTTKCLTLQDTKQELSNPNFSLVCLDYNLNKNFDFLKSLSKQEKSKTELLINAICPPNCPNRYQHYQDIGIYNLTFSEDQAPFIATEKGCGIKNSSLHPTCINSKNNLSFDEIQNIYEPLGITNFKIEGRTLPFIETACNITRYLIKPEYHFEFLNYLTVESAKIGKVNFLYKKL